MFCYAFSGFYVNSTVSINLAFFFSRFLVILFLLQPNQGPQPESYTLKKNLVRL
jgi:hypothetical protein